ncbi:hypothetical protein G6L68_25325 [Agrobacterium fabrum]|uniref:hypothetical protein n=1 Tax=Agrobacterium fabrum TaxID=1176649 RepID=UPI000EF5C01D|nr:hypothetical protein [Agrobacterium fabrum]AYM66210.1 hypothetical protein At12D13_50580 [Agrobacterium fabrum]NTE63956.1 hypothetical protein [Agrobacterium fabrum]
MNQHVTDVAKVEHIDPETGEITEVSATAAQPTDQAEAPAAETAAVEAEAVPESEKRTFPVVPVLKQAEPSLAVPAADRIDPNWGIAKYANRGAMHIERFFVMSEKLMWPSVLVALLAFALIFYAMAMSSSGGMTSFVGHRGTGGGGTMLLMMFLPFFVIGVVLTAIIINASDMQYEDPATLYAGGGLIIGGLLMAFWMYSAENPNGNAAWILFGLKIAIVIGLVIWIAHHLLKIRRSGESRAILWMVGGYVGIVVIASVVLTSLGTALSGFGPSGMSAISAMLTFDRDSYFDLGGGLRSGPENRWLIDYTPKGGLSVEKLNSLIGSVRADYANHSNDAANWEEVTKLAPQPMITRPEKAIRDNAKELPNGIVVVPEGGRDPVSIVAHVDGQWSITVIAPSNCAVILGPYDPKSGCENATTPEQPINGYVTRILDSIKPIPAAAEVKE